MNKLQFYSFPYLLIFFFTGCATDYNSFSRKELANVESTVHQSAACKLCQVKTPNKNVLNEIKRRGIDCAALTPDDCIYKNEFGEKKGQYSIGRSCFSGCDCSSGYCSPTICAPYSFGGQCTSYPQDCNLLVDENGKANLLSTPTADVCYSR